MIKFKEVAHLYLGCTVKYPNSDDKIVKAKLTGVNLESFETTYFRKKKGVSGDYISYNDGKNRGHNCYIENIKPVLRPLSSMTEDEDREFFGVVMNLNKQFRLEYGFKIKKENGFISIWDNDTDKWYTIIKPSGNGLPCFNCTYSMAETAWLLKKGIDLFGLIESGEALEEKPAP